MSCCRRHTPASCQETADPVRSAPQQHRGSGDWLVPFSPEPGPSQPIGVRRWRAPPPVARSLPSRSLPPPVARSPPPARWPQSSSSCSPPLSRLGRAEHSARAGAPAGETMRCDSSARGTTATSPRARRGVLSDGRNDAAAALQLDFPITAQSRAGARSWPDQERLHLAVASSSLRHARNRGQRGAVALHYRPRRERGLSGIARHALSSSLCE